MYISLNISNYKQNNNHLHDTMPQHANKRYTLLNLHEKSHLSETTIETGIRNTSANLSKK